MKKFFGISLVLAMFLTMGSVAYADNSTEGTGCNTYCSNQWYWSVCSNGCGQFNSVDFWQHFMEQMGWNCGNNGNSGGDNSNSGGDNENQQPTLPSTPSTPSVPDNTPDTDNGSNNGGNNDSNIENLSYVEQVVALVNEERAKEGLSPVALDSQISAAAQVRAKEAAQSFSHTRPNGSSCFTALKEAGISYRGAGENIAYGQATPSAVMQDWMNSSGHRANIMNAKYTKIGVGYTVINGVAYWAQFFTY